MSSSATCCTCATVICDHPTSLETKNEKQSSTPEDKRLDCCSRVICGRCIHTNPRFASYCPYCQIASNPSNPLPLGGLREPPSYDFAVASPRGSNTVAAHVPPPYTTATATSLNAFTGSNDPSSAPSDEKASITQDAQDTLHFLAPDDTLPSLSLRYDIPLALLRAHNRLPAFGADHLLHARRTLRIPPDPVTAQPRVSLSPRPVDGEAEEARKAAVRRWMVACKCADYEVAELYLGQSGGDVDGAVGAFLADEEWERRNPRGKGREGGRDRGGVWARQVAFWTRRVE
ncbi:unnamed protein product [Discula destructiva]